MGYEVKAFVRFGAERAEAKVIFEADHARIGKPFSLRLTSREVQAFRTENEQLVAERDGNELRIELPPGMAGRILARLKNPRSRAESLA